MTMTLSFLKKRELSNSKSKTTDGKIVRNTHVYKDFSQIKVPQSDLKEEGRSNNNFSENKNENEKRVKILSNRFIDALIQKEKMNNFNRAVELLKNNKIKEIIVAGDMNGQKGHKIDLDTRTALMLLNSFNKRKGEDLYQNGAKTSIYDKEKTNEISNKDNEGGLRVVIDTGGQWLTIEGSGKTQTLYIDHHGVGKDESTSATKMMYELLKKAELLEEEPWLFNFVSFVNNVDNLSYIYRTNEQGEKIFDEKYLLDKWTKSLVAFAEDNISFEELVEIFKNKKIKNPFGYLSQEELDGDIGDIKCAIKDKQKLLELPLREAIDVKREQVKKSLRSAKNILKYDVENNIALETKRFGKILFQDYKSKFIGNNGREIPNIIENKLAFKVIKALGINSFIVLNENKKSFFINSDKADLDLIGEDFNNKYGDYVKVFRGLFLFGKIPEGFNRDQFLDFLSIKNRKNKFENNNKEEREIA